MTIHEPFNETCYRRQSDVFQNSEQLSVTVSNSETSVSLPKFEQTIKSVHCKQTLTVQLSSSVANTVY
jgi:hypothetical protein